MKTQFQLVLCGLAIALCQYSQAQTTVALTNRTIVKLLADGARPRVYALNRGDGASPGSLMSLNPTNGQLQAEISLGLMPTDIAMTGAGEAAYVVNAGSRTLMKVDLATFSVAATRTISTPNTYDVNNPLYVAAGRSNVVYFTDGGWTPGVYTFDFQNGTNLALFDDDSGIGGLVATRDGNWLYTWRQCGWSAGIMNSWLTWFNAQASALAPVETSSAPSSRDPLNTPILLNRAETLVFNKQQSFVATNLSVPAQSFAENIYAITADGSIAFGNSRVFVSVTALELTNFSLSSTVQAVTGDQKSLFRYQSSPSQLMIYSLADIVGAGWETNQPPVAAFVRTPTNATTLSNIVFDGGLSTDDQGGGAALQYRWDWENDGVFDTAFTNQPVATHRYNITGTKTVALQIKDRYGATSIAVQSFDVVQQDDPAQPGGGTAIFEVQFPAADVVFDPVRPYAYVSGYDKKTLVMLNLTNGLVERQFSFGWNAESMTVSPDGQKLYVALLRRPHSYYSNGDHTNYIAEFDLAQQVKNKEFEILADPYDLAVTDSGILVVPGGSDQWTDIRTYRTSDGALLGAHNIRQMSHVSLHPSQEAVYTADTDSSPSQVTRYGWDPVSGEIVSWWGSPYWGNYPMNGNVWCHPNGAAVVTRGGAVFSSSPVQGQDMLYQRTLAGGSVECLAFDVPHNAFFTVGASNNVTWLTYYDAISYQLKFSQILTNAAKFIQASSRHVYFAWTTDTSTFFQRIQNPALPDAFITRDPVSQTVVVGGAVRLNVGTRGQGPLAYQWFFQGAELPDQTNAVLTLTRVGTNQEGDYFVTVTNTYASVTSSVAHLTVLVPPSIAQQPQALAAAAGTTVTFGVQAAGTPILNYQWSFEGVNVSGATNVSYSITNVQQAHEGAYRVTVQNSAGTVSSSPATLRVIPTPPTVLTNPVSQTVPAGTDVQLSVACSGSTPITCQWLFNGAPLPGAGGTSLTLTNVQTTNSGFYTAALINYAGQSFSAAASLTVAPSRPWFVTQPAGQSGAVGGLITLKAEARGSLPLGYQWRRNGLSLAAATAATLVLSNASIFQSGAYDLLASNSGGTVPSAVANVTITGAPPAFVQQPANASVNLGATLILNSQASGTDPVLYQWWFNNGPLPDQTGRVLTISNVVGSAAGGYWVVASNTFGQATSTTATVTVLMGPQFAGLLTNGVALKGQDVVLAVMAQGALPLTYYWYYNGLPCLSGTNALWLPNVQPTQAGAYRVVASNALGTASSSMSLFVFETPGEVVCWGDNSEGQASSPSGLTDIVRLAGGDFHSLALQVNGSVAGWGFNGNGQATPPSGLSNVVAIAAGAYHSLALKLNGQVVAWGYNAAGQTTVPANATTVVAIAAGESHSVAVRQDGSLIVWGDNTLGQRNIPASPGFVTALAAGRNHTLALRTNGTVIAWGLNSVGQTAVPSGLTGVQAIAAGYLHSVALRADGTVVAWGDNTYGQTSLPEGLSNIVAIAAGELHSYALRADGQVLAWGDDSWGQQDFPPLLHHMRSLGSGYYHGMATVMPMVNGALVEGRLRIYWAGPFTLEWAGTPSGPFAPISSVSPYTDECRAPMGFFRLSRSR